MNIACKAWLVVFSLFISAFLSALIISAIYLNMSAVFIVVLYCFVGTAILGLPASLLIHHFITMKGFTGFTLRLVAHAAAGAAAIYSITMINYTSWQNFIESVFTHAALLNAVLYFIVYTSLTRINFLKDKN